MRLRGRVDRLERQRGSGPCPGCGQIDWSTGSGSFSDAVLMNQDDGRVLCFCRWCARCWKGEVAEDDGLSVVGAVPAECPV